MAISGDNGDSQDEQAIQLLELEKLANVVAHMPVGERRAYLERCTSLASISLKSREMYIRLLEGLAALPARYQRQSELKRYFERKERFKIAAHSIEKKVPRDKVWHETHVRSTIINLIKPKVRGESEDYKGVLASWRAMNNIYEYTRDPQVAQIEERLIRCLEEAIASGSLIHLQTLEELQRELMRWEDAWHFSQRGKELKPGDTWPRRDKNKGPDWTGLRHK